MSTICAFIGITNSCRGCCSRSRSWGCRSRCSGSRRGRGCRSRSGSDFCACDAVTAEASLTGTCEASSCICTIGGDIAIVGTSCTFVIIGTGYAISTIASLTSTGITARSVGTVGKGRAGTS